jgi:hypothetical protein
MSPVTEIVGLLNNALKAAQGGVCSPTGNDFWTDTSGVRHGGDWPAPPMLTSTLPPAALPRDSLHEANRPHL